MQFEVETYLSEDTNKPMVFICSSDGASGATYPAKDIEQIARALTLYLEDYYPECVPQKKPAAE